MPNSNVVLSFIIGEKLHPQRGERPSAFFHFKSTAMKAELISLVVCVFVFGGYGKFLHGIITHGREPLIKYHMREGNSRDAAVKAVRYTEMVAWLLVSASGVVGVAVLASLLRQMGLI